MYGSCCRQPLYMGLESRLECWFCDSDLFGGLVGSLTLVYWYEKPRSSLKELPAEERSLSRGDTESTVNTEHGDCHFLCYSKVPQSPRQKQTLNKWKQLLSFKSSWLIKNARQPSFFGIEREKRIHHTVGSVFTFSEHQRQKWCSIPSVSDPAPMAWRGLQWSTIRSWWLSNHKAIWHQR